MSATLTRRHFLTMAASTPFLTGLACRSSRGGPSSSHRANRSFFFTSQGRTGMMNADGTGLRYLEFNAPQQVTWQPAAFFPDGQQVLMLSMEQRRDGPGRPFDQYYHLTPTHLWIYDLSSGTLTEIVNRERMAPFYTPQLLLPNERLLVQVVRDRVGQIFNMKLDGTDAREFTRAGEGLPYGLSLSPDGQRVAYHLASPDGYQIWTSDVEGGNRIRVAGQRSHLYFGPAWSTDGQWLTFQDCRADQDPGHDWSDVCLSRADGTEQRVVTQGQAMWFGATYGSPQQRGGGSNVVTWTQDGCLLFPRRLPDSKVPWEFQAHRPDTDHFNRDFKPELARGGTQIVKLDPHRGEFKELTPYQQHQWDFRASESADGRDIVFCRAQTGSVPAIWVMDCNGHHPKRLCQGWENHGADHPRWLPLNQVRHN